MAHYVILDTALNEYIKVDYINISIWTKKREVERWAYYINKQYNTTNQYKVKELANEEYFKVKYEK